MKLYLDDERKAPIGWKQCRWPSDVIEFLKNTTEVTEISLDHDLGADSIGTGYDVLAWIEEQVVCSNYVPPKIRIHTANPAARIRMERAVKSIERKTNRMHMIFPSSASREVKLR